MHVVSKPRLEAFWLKHADAKTGLELWFHTARKKEWKDLNDLKADFPSADLIKGIRHVFNIGGNKYRLVADIMYRTKKVYIRKIMTHAKYSKVKDIMDLGQGNYGV